ncbi:MAG: Rieske Fe-S protein [bacterium]|nr:Rieske Fe-S protein [bacterium]
MSVTRRTFLQTTAAGGAALVGASALLACGNDVVAPPLVRASVSDNPADGADYGTVRVATSDLALVGGAVTVELDPLAHPDILHPFTLPASRRLLVVHRANIGVDDSYIAVDSDCPHAGCPLGYADDAIKCPCHSSTFRAKVEGPKTCVGQTMHGPARQDVNAYQVTLADDLETVVIDLKVINGCDTLRLPPVVGGKLTLTLAQFPELQMVGAAVIGRPQGSTSAVAIVRTSAAGDASAFVALSAVCTHLGCTVAYSDGSAPTSCGAIPAGGGFWCSCHCSQFALDGSVLVGPATKALPKYAVAFDGATLTITIA